MVYLLFFTHLLNLLSSFFFSLSLSSIGMKDVDAQAHKLFKRLLIDARVASRPVIVHKFLPKRKEGERERMCLIIKEQMKKNFLAKFLRELFYFMATEKDYFSAPNTSF